MPTFRQFAILLLSGTFVLTPGDALSETLNVNLVLSDGSAPYSQFAESFNKALGANKAEVAVVGTRDPMSSHADLIVAVGIKAAELAVSRNGAPVLAVMIPDNGYQELLALPSRKIPHRSISAIYVNQPWDRQLNFLQAALPERHRIGLLHSLGTPIDIEGLRRQLARHGRSLLALPVRSAERLFPALESVFDGSDLLLAVPDTAIYNSNSIRNILLASYNRRIPLIGFSQSYVNAGALCAIFSTTEQVAEQTGAAVLSFSRTGRLPDPQYPAEFTIAVNQQVARSLNIELPTPETIHERMDKPQSRKHEGRQK